MQAATALRVGLPGLPDGQEIEPDAEIGIDDDEALAALPALRQPLPASKVWRTKAGSMGCCFSIR
jgi:hypothetical protein